VPSTSFLIGSRAPRPLQALTLSDLVHDWPDESPKVSILVATFNHEEFVSDTLNGLLAQKTTFPFEILVWDDASTDSTGDILRDFEGRYAGIVRLTLNTCRQFPRVRSNEVLRPTARGQKIAYCEGDDYWIDSRKLEQQFYALNQSSGTAFSVCRRVVIEDDAIVRGPEMGGEQTLMHSADFKHDPAYFHRLFSYDVFLSTILRSDCNAVELDFVGAVYRRHSRGISTSLKSGHIKPELRLHQASTHFWLGTYFADKGEFELADKHYAEALVRMLRWRQVRKAVVLRKAIIHIVRRWARKKYRALRSGLGERVRNLKFKARSSA